MGKKAFDKIAEGLNETLAIARGKAKPARLHSPTPKIRNAKTRAAMAEADGGSLRRFDSVENLMTDLNTETLARRAKKPGKRVKRR